ncbi:hypothetical protein ACTXN8_03225 [Pseudomonas helleri]|uniref:hypothetical protein n=1 Tax=Pseudomonas helleri TaxID=1608996 RepID=UPI003FD49AC2
MKFLEIGEGAKIGELTVNKNIMVVDDVSKIQTFVSIGKNGDIIRINADGNEVHTPESYADKLKIIRGELFNQLNENRTSIESITDDLAKRSIKSALKEAEAQTLDEEGEWKVQEILCDVLKVSKEVGAAVLVGVITSYLGV